jgi:hypothetical protein
MNKFIVESVANPTYASEDKKLIKADVKFTCFSEPVSFVASPDDVEAHGVQLHKNMSSGMYGLIAPYVAPPAPPAPPAPTKEELMAQIQALVAKVEAME